MVVPEVSKLCIPFDPLFPSDSLFLLLDLYYMRETVFVVELDSFLFSPLLSFLSLIPLDTSDPLFSLLLLLADVGVQIIVIGTLLGESPFVSYLTFFSSSSPLFLPPIPVLTGYPDVISATTLSLFPPSPFIPLYVSSPDTPRLGSRSFSQ